MVASVLALAGADVATAAATTSTVKPSAMNGWATGQENGPNGSVTFATPPAAPAVGTGSARFQLADAGAGFVLGTAGSLGGTRFDSLTTLSYDTYRASVDAGNNLGVALQIPIDFDVTDSSAPYQGRLVYEPYQNNGGNLPQNTWQTWNTLTGPSWWQTSSNTFKPVVGDVVQSGPRPCTQATPCTLAALLQTYPDAGFHSDSATHGGLLLKAGSNWSGFDGYADNLVVATAAGTTTYDFEAETACTTTCYVDGATGNDIFGGDTPNSAKKTIQAAVNQASSGATVNVAAGNYAEDVTINKDLSLVGAGSATTTITGQIGGGSATIQVGGQVEISGFTITRAGNNVADWNLSLNTAGVAVQGLTAAVDLHDNVVTGNRNGIDVNNSNGNSITDNVISDNRTGAIFRNQTDNTSMTGNEIEDNWTVGILFLDGSGGSNSPVQSAATSTFSRNSISGNWYGQVVDRQSGGSLPTPGTNTKHFACNYFGTATPVLSTANSTEPGYSALIPVEFGGTAVAPGGQPELLGPASANIEYVPFLIASDLTGDCDPIAQGDIPSDASGDEGTTVTASGSFTGTGVTIDHVGPGDLVDNSDGTWSWSLDADDDLDSDVTVTGTDAYGNTEEQTFAVTVSNVAPVATLVTPADATQNTTYEVSMTSPQDPSSADTTAGFEYAFDCGTGFGAFGSATSITCPAPAATGPLTVSASIRDKDGGVTTSTSDVEIIEFVPLAPSAPTSVTARPGDASANVRWKAPSSAGTSPITGYRIQMSRNGGAWKTAVADTGSTTRSATVTGLDNGAEYRFRVSAINAVDPGPASSASNKVVPRTTASKVRDLTATPKPSAVRVAWTAPRNDGGSAVKGYRVAYSVNGGDWAPLVKNTGSVKTSFLADDLSSTNRYRFRVRAINAAGLGDRTEATPNVRPL